MAWRLNGVLIFAVLAALVGCGGGTEVSDSELVDMAGGELSETVPVSGTITIDGTPTKNVVIYAYNSTSGMEAFAETKSQEDGTYCWSTYKACDGIAPGEYKLAFAYIPKDGKGGNPGKDELGGKYRNPMEGGFELSVQSGVPQEGVDYKLESGN